MNKAYPSMTALLGLLAIAGFQNRDKLAELLRGQMPGGNDGAIPPGTPHPGSQQGTGAPGGLQQGGLGGVLGNLGAGGLGGLLGGGLGELVEKFRQSGHGDAADSWIGTGPNKDVAPQDLEQAIGPDVLDTLEKQTGLSRADIVARLSKDLPTAVDHYTPDGRLPPAIDNPFKS